MAQPEGVRPERGMPRYFACALALYASDRTYGIEIQRAPDSGGSPDVGNAETITEVPGSTQVYIDERAGDGSQVHYRIRHIRTGETASSWTPWVALTPTFFTSAQAPAPVIPSVTETPTDDGATGTLALALTDPQNRLVSVKAKYRSGNGSEEGSWDTLSLAGGVYTDTVDLALKHPSTIRYQLTYYDEQGNEIATEKVVPFPLASKPAKPIVTLAIDTSGNITAQVEGDSDTVNIRAKGDTSAYPNAAAVDAMDPDAGSSVTTGTLVNLNAGDTAYVSVRAYDENEAGSDLAKAMFTAISEELNDLPDAPDSVTLSADSELLEVKGPDGSIVSRRYVSTLSMSIVYTKDGLFRGFRYRIWNGSEDKEEAEIFEVEGLGGSSPYTILAKRTDKDPLSATWHCEVEVINDDGQVSGWASDDDTAEELIETLDQEGARRGRGLLPDGEPDPERDPDKTRQRRSRDLFSGDGAAGGHRGRAGSGDTEAVGAEDVDIGGEPDYRRPLKDVIGVGSDGVPEITDPSGNRMIDLENRDIDGSATIDGDTATDVKDGSGRARAGLTGDGDVDRDVPLAKAVANVDGIDTSTGKVDEAVETKAGTTLENTTSSQSKADAAESAAVSTASSDATTKADAAEAAAEATAAADATTKADAAEAAAAADATTKADAAEADAKQEITDRGLADGGDFTGTVDGDTASDVKDGSSRARTGLESNGDVSRDVPLAKAVANVDGIDTTTGLVDEDEDTAQGRTIENTVGSQRASDETIEDSPVGDFGNQRRERDLFSGDGAPAGHSGTSGSGDTEEMSAEDIEIGSDADTKRPLKDILDIDVDGDPVIRDPETDTDLKIPTMQDSSDRAQAGLTVDGDVDRDVPLAKAVANVDGIDTASGKIDEGVETKGGETLENTTNSQSKADTAQSDAEATASADATSKADTAQSNAEATASADATSKADTAQSNAEATASADATSKADTAEADAKQEITDRGLDDSSDFTGTIDGTAASSVEAGADRANNALDANNQVTDQTVLHGITAGSRGSMIKGPINLVGSDVGTSAQIAWDAFSLQTGDGEISYVTGGKVGLAFSTKYYIYVDDPNMNGGASGYVFYATTSWEQLFDEKGFIYMGVCTTPADGGNDTGGTEGGGGGPAE